MPSGQQSKRTRPALYSPGVSRCDCRRDQTASGFFFFKQKTAYEIQGDWSSDVCSSDLDSGPHVRRRAGLNVQVSGYVQAGASPNVWPRVCPTGLPFFLSATPILRYSSSVRGGSDADRKSVV